MTELNDDPDNRFDDMIPEGVVDSFQYVEKPPLTPEQEYDAILSSLFADIALDTELVRREDETIDTLSAQPITIEQTVAIDDAKIRRQRAMARIAQNKNRIIEV